MTTYSIRNPSFAAFLFYCANIAFVMLMNYGLDDPLQFLLLSSGIVLFSFFVKRVIHMYIGL
jgi:hypothetical protein